MTKVINLLGGPGVGKSVTAAFVYGKLKSQGFNVELAREVAKDWAWEGRVPSRFDQTYLFGAQSRVESRLYSKVDYIVSESPLMLSAIYELFYFGDSITEPSLIKYLTSCKRNGIIHFNYLLTRKETYKVEGRFQTLDQAQKIDDLIKIFLKTHKLDFKIIDSSFDKRADQIIEDMI